MIQACMQTSKDSATLTAYLDATRASRSGYRSAGTGEAAPTKLVLSTAPQATACKQIVRPYSRSPISSESSVSRDRAVCPRLVKHPR